MFVVGLTGGIASGKTAVSDEFSRLGIDIIDADIVAREVVAPGSIGLSNIQATFGDDVIDSDGELNRRALRDIVFADKSKLEQLEAITHPLIRQRIDERITTSTNPYALLVVPLLIEKNWQEKVDRILVVDVDRTTQLERLTARDNCDIQQAESILASQTDADTRLAHADDVIRNDKDIESLKERVAELHKAYLALAANPHPS